MGKHEECEAPAGAPPPIPNRDAERGYKKVACEPNVVAELASRIQREEDKIAATRQLATSLSGEEKELKAHLEAEMEETGMLIEALRQNLEVLKQVGGKVRWCSELNVEFRNVAALSPHNSDLLQETLLLRCEQLHLELLLPRHPRIIPGV